MKNIMVTLVVFSVIVILVIFYDDIFGKKQAVLPEKGELVVWQTESDPGAIEVLKKIEQDFEGTFPNIDLQIKTVGWGDLSKKLGIAQRKQEFPDVSHLQPFMAYSLVSRDLLAPITKLVAELNQLHGGILPAVHNLQMFDGRHYGLAYAVGATFWLTRADKLEGSNPLSSVNTWKDYLELISESKNEDGSFVVTLPGGSPFFIRQLYGELLANAGGRFFDPKNLNPEMDSKENIAVLNFFRQLAQTGVLDDAWATTSYTAQFEKIADGEVHGVPVTYARASRNIEHRASTNGGEAANPSVYSWLNQPVPSFRSSEKSIATIDAEPYVVFQQAATKKYKNGRTNYDLAIEYLRLFYSEKYYSEFTSAVPVQLTPIFRDMATSEKYLESVGKWAPWHNQTMILLSDLGRTRPIMMPDASEKAKTIPFLLEFEASGIISKAVSSSILESNRDIYEIASQMQKETIEWKKSIEYPGKKR